MSDPAVVAPLNPLSSEHAAEARAARRQRRVFQRSPLGSFARQLEDTMTEYHKARAQGVSREDAMRGIEGVLRECWPKPTSKFYVCADCDGTGWREKSCWAEHRCGRQWCSLQHPACEHAYVVPCECSRGDRHRVKAMASEDAIAALGRTGKKSTAFTRVGQS